jgi:helicase-like protein/type III restriction/modification enzyme restriction subunit
MVELLPHQKRVLEYLISSCRKQHGLIVNHIQGSGKTIIGATFLKNFPNSKKVIVLPSSLVNTWKRQIQKFKIGHVDYLTYESIKHYVSLGNLTIVSRVLKDSVCVADEVNTIYSIIDILYEKTVIDKSKNKIVISLLIQFIDSMYSTKKILLMTGSIEDIVNIRWLINIAYGKEDSLVPFDKQTFLDKYEYINPIDSLYVKVLIPFVKLNPLNIIPKNILKKIPFGGDNSIDLIFGLLIPYITPEKFKGVALTNDLGIFDVNRYKLFISDILSHVVTKEVAELVKNKDLNKISKYKGDIIDYKKLGNALFLFLIFRGLIFALQNLKRKYRDSYIYTKLDVNKLKRDHIDRYFSFFNYHHELAKNYPESNIKTIKVNYTKIQLVTLIRFMSIPENLTNEEYVLLELNKTIREAELFRDELNVKNKFLDKGRIIGNLFDNPLKFNKIVKCFEDCGNQQTVVYSNFYESGIVLFGKYLKERSINYTILNLGLSEKSERKIFDDFKNKKIKMLLLHPDYFEGISIVGCRYFHILDPVISETRREQLYARVIRLNSHAHLPVSEQKVNIINWGCSLIQDINKILYTKSYIKEWNLSLNKWKSILDIIEAFKGGLSPDDKVLGNYLKYKNYRENLDTTIKALSIESEDLPKSQCCIWTPGIQDKCKSKSKCWKMSI